MNLRTLIIDDEPHAREGVRLRLAEFENIEIIGECSYGSDAVEMITEMQPDIIFLDIQLSDMNGFEVLQKVEISPMPLVVFVTAYDQHAIRAFEFNAFDYLLKPINDERFKKVVKKAIAEFKENEVELYAERLNNIINNYLKIIDREKPDENSKPVDRLLIKNKENISFISVNEIDWIESAGDYVYVHQGDKKHLIRETLISLEEKLDKNKFSRIHRTAIINIDKINILKYSDHGEYDVYLKNGVKLKLSRTYKDNFQKVIGNSL